MKNFFTGIFGVAAAIITIVNVLEKVGIVEKQEIPVVIVNSKDINHAAPQMPSSPVNPVQILPVPPSTVPIQSPQQADIEHSINTAISEKNVSCEDIKVYMDDTDEMIFYSAIKTGKERVDRP